MSAPKRRSWLRWVGRALGLVLVILAGLTIRYAVQRAEHQRLREAEVGRAPVALPKRAAEAPRPAAVAPASACIRGVVLDHGAPAAGMQVSLSDVPPSVSADCPCAHPAATCACQEGLAMLSSLPRAGVVEAVRSATTAADGRFELCDLAGVGPRLLWAEHADGRMASATSGPLVTPGSEVTLEVIPLIAVQGTVLSGQSPVAGAAVLGFTVPAISYKAFTTDERGRFEVKLPLNVAQFVVTAPGRSAQLVKAYVTPGQLLVLRIQDEAELVIRALSDGKPVASASVVIGAELPKLTGEQGVAVFSGLAAGTQTTVTVTKGELIGEATFTLLPKTRRQLDVALRKGVRVTGTIVDEQGAHQGRVRGLGKSIASDPQGHFVSPLMLPFRTVSPVGVADGCADSPYQDVKLADVDLDVTLKIACVDSVTGVVLDADGKPVAEAAVFIDSTDHHEAFTTAADGQFHFHRPAGTYQLSVLHERYRKYEQPLQVPARNVTIVLDAGGSISGRVLTGKGTPVVGAHVMVVPAVLDRMLAEAEGPGRSAGVTDAEGRFEATGLLAGRLAVAASAAGEGTSPSEVVVLQPGEHREGVTLTLDEEIDIQGTVTDEQRLPVPGVSISWDPADEKSALLGILMDAAAGHADRVLKFMPEKGQTDADGHYTLKGVPVSTVKLSVRAAGFQDETRVVSRGETADFTLKRDGGRVHGRVVDEAGRALTAFSVDGAAYTPEDGRFEMQTHQKDEMLTVGAKGYSKKSVHAVVSAEDTDLGDIALSKGLTLAVEVVTDDGTAVDGARVYVSQKGDSFSSSTAADGHVSLEGLQAVEATVKVTKDGFVPFSQDVSAGQVSQPLKVTLAVAGGRITGVAFIAPGAASAARSVSLSGAVSKNVMTDARGHFEAVGIPEGPYCASIDMPGSRFFEWAVAATASSAPAEVVVGPITVGSMLEISRAVPARVVLVKGTAAAAPISKLIDESASSVCQRLQATVIATVVVGTVRIDGLPPGHWSVYVLSITQAEDQGNVEPIGVDLLPNDTRKL